MTTDDLTAVLTWPGGGEARILCRKGARLTLSWGDLLQADWRTALGAMRTGQRPGWVAVEVRAHNRRPKALTPYASDPQAQARNGCTFYGRVPIEVVEQLITAYGGIETCTTNT